MDLVAKSDRSADGANLCGRFGGEYDGPACDCYFEDYGTGAEA